MMGLPAGIHLVRSVYSLARSIRPASRRELRSRYPLRCPQKLPFYRYPTISSTLNNIDELWRWGLPKRILAERRPR